MIKLKIQNSKLKIFESYTIIFKLSKQKGQSLIEVLVGLATAVLIVGAITIATISALNNAVYSKNQNLATNYAQQGMEIVRNLRDRNYTLFTQLTGDYCLAKSCNQIDPTGGANDPCGKQSVICAQNVGGENADIFVRTVSVTQDSLFCMDGITPTPGVQGALVDVNVSWYDSKCGSSNIFCHNVNLSTCLSTYNAISSQ